MSPSPSPRPTPPPPPPPRPAGPAQPPRPVGPKVGNFTILALAAALDVPVSQFIPGEVAA